MKLKKRQLDLFHEEPRYREYVDKYLNPKDPGNWTIIYLFKKHCGADGVLNPCDEHIKDKIFNDLEKYGGYGEYDDVIFKKYLYKQIVNMYWYVIGREDNVQPVQHWTEQISI